MHYLKCSDPISSYCDPKTRQTIGRGEIVALTTLTESMRARLRKRGLIEVTEAEYNKYLVAKGLIKEVETPSQEVSEQGEVTATPPVQDSKVPPVEEKPATPKPGLGLKGNKGKKR